MFAESCKRSITFALYAPLRVQCCLMHLLFTHAVRASCARAAVKL